MIAGDGTRTIYLIQHRQTPVYPNAIWTTSNLDFFGYPPGFNASGKCWQETGIHGTLDDLEARNGLKWIREKHPAYTFRCVKLKLTRKSTVTSW